MLWSSRRLPVVPSRSGQTAHGFVPPVSRSSSSEAGSAPVVSKAPFQGSQSYPMDRVTWPADLCHWCLGRSLRCQRQAVLRSSLRLQSKAPSRTRWIGSHGPRICATGGRSRGRRQRQAVLRSFLRLPSKAPSCTQWIRSLGPRICATGVSVGASVVVRGRRCFGNFQGSLPRLPVIPSGSGDMAHGSVPLASRSEVGRRQRQAVIVTCDW